MSRTVFLSLGPLPKNQKLLKKQRISGGHTEICGEHNVLYRQRWLSAIMWQIYFQSNLNLFSAGSSVQTLIQGIIICIGTSVWKGSKML